MYVGNLSFSSTEEQIRAMFAQHGEVASVSMITDRDTGQPRGFGFVEMPNDSQAQAAIAALNGQNFQGRNLNVSEARPKTGGAGGGGGGRERSGGGGGGRGGDRGRGGW